MKTGKQRKPAKLAQSVVFLYATTMSAQTYTFFDVPGATNTYPYSINNRGEVTGSFDPGTFSGDGSAFVRDPQGNITIVDVPNAWATLAVSINDRGDITGNCGLGNPDDPTIPRPFVRTSDGNITLLNVPGNVYSGVRGINNSGEVVGVGNIAGAPWRGIIWNQAGTFTFFDVPNSISTLPGSINDPGDITGSFTPLGGGRSWGFVRDSNGNFETFRCPGPADRTDTFPEFINSSGEIVGRCIGLPPRGFVRDKNGNITTFDLQGNTWNTVLRINEPGIVAGTYSSPVVLGSGFVRDREGNISLFNVTGARGTGSIGINNRGDVLGGFQDFNWRWHGFVRTK